VAISDVILLADAARDQTAGTRFVVVLLGVFAGIAWLLAAVGIYGVTSHGVALRRHEIGIRLALGASRARIVGVIVGEGLTVTAAGVAVGAAAALALGGALSGLLFGVAATDVTAFAVAAAALALAAAAASLLPALRASGIEPGRELR
jgi:putative ABC transport system permease protein